MLIPVLGNHHHALSFLFPTHSFLWEDAGSAPNVALGLGRWGEAGSTLVVPMGPLMDVGFHPRPISFEPYAVRPQLCQPIFFLAEADKTLESGLILDGMEVCRCSPMVPCIPILLNSNHSVGIDRARRVDLPPCPQAFSSGSSIGISHCEC